MAPFVYLFFQGAMPNMQLELMVLRSRVTCFRLNQPGTPCYLHFMDDETSQGKV